MRRAHSNNSSSFAAAAAAVGACLEALEDRRLLSFSPVVVATSGSFPVTHDFNNDGRLDLATVTDDATDINISVVLGNGDGTFRQPPLRTALALGPRDSSSAYPQSLSVGDFNKDGKFDLAVAILHYDTLDNEIRILVGNGGGTFAPAAPVPAAHGYWSILAAAGDLNGDGKEDLVSTSNNDPWSFDSEILEVRLGRGDGTFTDGGPYYSDDLDLDLYLPELADFNGDGRLDVAVPAINRNGSSVRVYLGNGNGSLQVPPREVIYPFRADYPDPLVSGDFNGDGRADLVADSTVLLSNGDGTFRTAGAIGGGFLARDAGDIDGDGRLDLVAVNDQGGMGVFLGKGDGSFAPAITAGSSPQLLADFNSDGRPDAVVSGDGSISVMVNDGNWGSLPPSVSIGDATVIEGNNGTTGATFTLTLSRAVGFDVTVHCQLADIDARAGSDYAPASGYVVIPAGRTSATISVAVIGDRLVEAQLERFAVNLISSANAVIADGQGVGTIRDDEPRISIINVSQKEGKGNKNTLFTFTVTLSAAYDEPVTVGYATADRTATVADNDYSATSGMLTFAAAETTKTITVLVKADKKKESDETFFLNLFNASSNALIYDPWGIGTIFNDD
jgi:hypothetical protein